jgi:phage terminase large subunit-like protein
LAAKTKTPSFAARVNRYARAVCSGKVSAGKLVVAACRRHLDDLECAKDPQYPYTFSERAVRKICLFAENMVHIKGKWAVAGPGELPFIHLEDWQVFLLGCAFGWLRRDDQQRRFREIYAEIPRKNSKSTLGAIIGLYMTCADGEQGAEVFAGATSMEQSYQVFRPAWLMVKKNPDFRQHFGLELSGTERNPGNIFQLSTNSRFEPLIGKPGDGASPHCAVVDEYHEHTTPDLYDAMKTGMGARTQPMRVIITTAGTNTAGPCYEKHLEAIKVLDHTMDNEELFTVIFGIDVQTEHEAGDDWTHFAVWKKANPNYGVSLFEDYLRGQLRDGMQSPSQQNIILTKNLNQWMSTGVAWMNMTIWERQRNSQMKLADFAGCPCWLAFDLASKIDIASVAAIFRPDWGTAFFCKHYLPAETIALPPNAHYRRWRDQGWLIETPGARTDFRMIEDDIKAMSKMFAVKELGFDQRESGYLIANIQNWASFECVEIPQAPAHFNEPMKEMEAQIYAGTLKHAGDPVLTWMMSNTIKKQSHGGGPVKYYYPTKDADKNKIDGVVAGIMALGRAMVLQPEREYQLMFV